jgi:hypothetical protein
MPLTSVLSVEIRPDRLRQYAELVQSLAARAAEQKEEFHWTAHQTTFGELGTMYFVSEDPDYAGLATRGTTQELILRVLGDDEGVRTLDSFSECIVSQRLTVSVDRPDLSYPPEPMNRIFPSAVVTEVRIRAGGRDALEELVRKIAEAIPKVDDPMRLTTYQVVLGNLSEIWTIRPFEDLSELDDQLVVAELLNQAFGVAEGGLIFRTGLEAIEEMTRQVTVYREDLSNPG